MKERTERRKYHRIPVELSTHMRKVGDEGFFVKIKAMIKDISLGGIFIGSSILFEVDSFIKIEFLLPDEKEPISMNGFVRWLKESPPMGMGIEIIQSSMSDQDRIQELLKVE